MSNHKSAHPTGKDNAEKGLMRDGEPQRTAGGQRLLQAAKFGQDAGVIDAHDQAAFIARGKGAPVGPGKIRPHPGLTACRTLEPSAIVADEKE